MSWLQVPYTVLVVVCVMMAITVTAVVAVAAVVIEGIRTAFLLVMRRRMKTVKMMMETLCRSLGVMML